MLSSPFEKKIAFVVKTTEDEDPDSISREELALLSPKAVAKRRRHFVLGRQAAHCALKEFWTKYLDGKDVGPGVSGVLGDPVGPGVSGVLGVSGASGAGFDPDAPILQGPSGEPIWPKGIVGAITHSGDVAAAAVGHQTFTAGIGLDIELIGRKVTFEIVKHVCGPREREWVETWDKDEKGDEGDEGDTDETGVTDHTNDTNDTNDADDADLRLKMVFCAKEAVFKAFYPVEKIWLGFSDAELLWDQANKRFDGSLRKCAGGHFPDGYEFKVGCCVEGKYIVAFMQLPPLF